MYTLKYYEIEAHVIQARNNKSDHKQRLRFSNAYCAVEVRSLKVLEILYNGTDVL